MTESAKKSLPGAAWNVSDQEARKQLKKFLIAGWVIAGVSLFAFGWLAIASAGFGGRCIVLSWRKVNASRPNGTWLKVASVGLLVLSVLEVIAVNATRK